ncbi:MAG: tRNA (adenosine(37)-N6)-dimethylallyltransferase MiaA [Chloroflexi bacterium]|nr:tRNA (adenosine(37)-N6)-dimethylallyltransferase MiaA [Chloroflexota bacterium]
MAGPLIVIFGPTAVGKSALALTLARECDGEIISADSRQVYRGMDIGTDKPTVEEQRLVAHHLINTVAPDEEFTLAQYQQLAYQRIDEIHGRGKVPFLVGGTALYIKAVIEGWRIPHVMPDPELRHRLASRAELEGVDALHAELQQVDPVAAEEILPGNSRRVIRALEVFYSTGKRISDMRGKHPTDYRILRLGLTMERRRLYERIDRRVDAMIKSGLVEEVERLTGQGYGLDLPSMSGLGYREIGQYLTGQMSLDEAVQKMKFDTHRFVRHQYVWFRREEDVNWLDMGEPDAAARAHILVCAFLGRE